MLSADALVEEGFILSSARRWEEAIGRYQQALKIDPQNQKAFRNLGFALNHQGRFEDAESALTKGLELESDVPSHRASLLHERAFARAELKKYPEALSDVDEALRIIRFSVKSLYLRARIHLYGGVPNAARKDAQDVLKSVPDHAGALRLLDQLSTQT